MFSQLAKNAIGGKHAKKRLGRKLAGLSPEKLKQVSPAVFALLGPVGLAEFAAHSKRMSDIVSEPKASGRRKSPFKFSFRKAWRFWHPNLQAAAITVVTTVIGLALSAILEMHPVPPSPTPRIGTWPVCATLDSWTDGCRYIVTWRGTTLAMLAVPLDISAKRLAFNNDINANAPLNVGSSIIVLRIDLFGNWEANHDIF
jgi:hypothetical protein